MLKKFLQALLLLSFLTFSASNASASSILNTQTNVFSSNTEPYTTMGILMPGDVVEVLYEVKGYSFVAIRQSSNFTLFNKSGWLPSKALSAMPTIPPQDVDLGDMVHSDLVTLQKQIGENGKPDTSLVLKQKIDSALREAKLVLYANSKYEVLLSADLKTIISLQTYDSKLATPAGIKVGSRLSEVMKAYGQYDYTITKPERNTSVLTFVNPGKKEKSKASILATMLQIHVDTSTSTVKSIYAGELFEQ